jgi:plasmid stability protein
MTEIVIRDVDDRVVDRLKTRAAAQQKSFEQFLRDLLQEAARPNRAELNLSAPAR